MEGKQGQQPKKLEDHEPGATRDEVFQALSKIAAQKTQGKRKAKKPAAPLGPASS